ncbi:MAG: hypothetical protein V8Q80_01090 [Barnesiella intestinihominis]
MDYKLAHSGEPTNVTREAVIDNDYLQIFGEWVIIYFFVRHCDGLQIDRDMHLMTNDLIILNAQVSGYTGAVTMTYPIIKVCCPMLRMWPNMKGETEFFI